MSVESEIEHLMRAVTLLIEAQRKEVTKRKDLQALTLGLLDAVQGQHEANDLLRAGLNEVRADNANLEVKFNALVDAQIRTQDQFQILGKTVNTLAETVAKLVERNGNGTE